jgi:hypothetical protein
MPEITACPDCNRKLRVPDTLLGRKVKCPGCGIQFTASAVTEEAPPTPPPSKAVATEPRASRRPRDEDEDERPRRRRDADDEPPRRRRDEEDDDDFDSDRADSPRSLRETWQRVRSGINFVIVSIWVTLGGVGLSMLGGMIVGGMGLNALTSNSRSGLTSAGNGLMALMVLGTVINFVALGLRVTGHAFGLAVPQKPNNPVRGLAIAAFILTAAFAALSVLQVLIGLIAGADSTMGGFSPSALVGSGITGILAGLVQLAALIVFLFYLRALCRAVRKEGLAKTVTSYIITVGVFALVCGVVVGIMFLMMGVAFDMGTSGNARGAASAAQGAGFMVIGFTCLGFVVFLGLFVWYVVILHQVRGAVDTYIRRL